MSEDIKKKLLGILEADGIKKTRDKFQKAPLYNLPNHIRLAGEVLDFINEYEMEERDKKIKSLFERRILLFKDYKKRV